MATTFLTAAEVKRTLTKFMADYDEFYWAVAWGTVTPVTDLMMEHANKFVSVTFGIAFSQTHPDFVDKLIDVKTAYVASEFVGGSMTVDRLLAEHPIQYDRD